MTLPEQPWPTTPAGCADAAAELIRAVNHGTRPGVAHLGVTDLYDLLGGLALLAGRLPQALTQVEALLDVLVENHQVVIVDDQHADGQDVDPVVVAAVAGHWLQAARTAAAQLAHATDQAQQALTWAATPDPDGDPGR